MLELDPQGKRNCGTGKGGAQPQGEWRTQITGKTSRLPGHRGHQDSALRGLCFLCIRPAYPSPLPGSQTAMKGETQHL